jgi:acyl-CoA dehydrogenase
VDFSVPEDHTAIRAAVRELCAAYPDAYWRGLDQTRAYPTEFVRALTDAGWLAVLVPVEYGGAGLGITEASIVLEEINRSGGNAATAHAQMYIMGTVLRHGSADQKQRYLPAVARGQLRLQAFGVTEPDAGSETTRLKTLAVRRGDCYVVNGQKVWTSRAEHSDLLLLLARTTPYDELIDKTRARPWRADRSKSGRSRPCSITTPPSCSSRTSRSPPPISSAKRARAFATSSTAGTPSAS